MAATQRMPDKNKKDDGFKFPQMPKMPDLGFKYNWVLRDNEPIFRSESILKSQDFVVNKKMKEVDAFAMGATSFEKFKDKKQASGSSKAEKLGLAKPTLKSGGTQFFSKDETTPKKGGTQFF